MGELTKPSVIRAMMKEANFFFKKNLGQNFLTSGEVASMIVEEVLAGNPDAVLEVGPGAGALTELLCESGTRTVAVECDPFASKMLANALSGHSDKLGIVTQDILKSDIPALMDGLGPRLNAVSNLPYYIASRIVGSLLEARIFGQIVVMMQKELADRLCQEALGARRSSFGVYCEYFADVKKLFEVSRNCFFPAPNVDSVVVAFTPRRKEGLEIKDEAFFLGLVRKSFAMRRKTLLNCLSSGYPLDREVCGELIASCGISPSARAETLDIYAFGRLSDALGEALGS